jgi:hypothetical protein
MGPRVVFDISRGDRFVAIAGVQTLICPACSLVNALTMLCHLRDVPNKINFGQEMCS